MTPQQLTRAQEKILQSPISGATFLEGPAGSGKTTVAAARIHKMVQDGVSPTSILILTPQRSLAEPYLFDLSLPEFENYSIVEHMTMNGLAQRMVDLFWPLIAAQAGFENPSLPPIFLTMETAQFFMAALARPYLERGYFESVVMDRNRLYSQVIDNLNKAALVGFPAVELENRLSAAWIGEPGQRTIYAQAQELALDFRRFCLKHNLLDFSLQLEVFRNVLWPLELFQDYLHRRFRHLVFDNLEEDTPLTHDLITAWLPDLDSAFLVYDSYAGYRLFLGADPDNAQCLKPLCDHSYLLDENLVNSPEMIRLGSDFQKAMGKEPISLPLFSNNNNQSKGLPVQALHLNTQKPARFQNEMLDWLADEVVRLVKQDEVSPDEIAILSPFLSDALRFGLVSRIEAKGIPVHTYRPSRGLRDEASVRCLVTLAELAHPAWGFVPTPAEVEICLLQVIDELDVIRAQLLVDVLYSRKNGIAEIRSFDLVRPEMRERITYRFGEQYEKMRKWLAAYQSEKPIPLDHFFSRIFGELLSQPKFGFHQTFDRGAAVARLVESARKFRFVAGGTMEKTGWETGREYLYMVKEGVIASQYQTVSWADEEKAVLIAPAFSFLMRNKPVDVQFWLDVGSLAWWERLNQPLTQPYVLSRSWPDGRPWTDADEFQSNQEMLARIISGLLRRCRQQLYLGIADLSVQGYEQQGPLLQVIQRVLRYQADANTSQKGIAYV